MEPPALSTSEQPLYIVIPSLGLHLLLSSPLWLRGASDLSCCRRDKCPMLVLLRHTKAPSIVEWIVAKCQSTALREVKKADI